MAPAAVHQGAMRITSVLFGLLTLCVLAAGLVVVLANYWILMANIRNARRGIRQPISFVPFVGPIIFTFGCLLITFVHGPPFWLLLAPWIVDPGTWVAVAAVAMWVRRM
jgi:hypothetical protein